MRVVGAQEWSKSCFTSCVVFVNENDYHYVVSNISARIRTGSVVALFSVLAMLAMSCGGSDSAPSAKPDRPSIVVTYSILGAVVADVVGDAADVNINGRQCAHVGRGVHLVDQRPNRGRGCDNACPGGRVIQEIPAGSCAIISMGHECFSLPLAALRASPLFETDNACDAALRGGF